MRADPLQHSDYIWTFQTLADFNGQAFPCVHIHYRQRPKPPAVTELSGHEIQAPDLVRPFRPRLLPAVLRDHSPCLRPPSQSQLLLALQTINQLLAHLPTFPNQPHPQRAVAVSNPRVCQLPQTHPQRGQRIAHALVPVRRSRQQHYCAGTPLADSVPAAQVRNHCATAGGRYQFFRSTSCNIARSSVSSATNFFSLPFSSCSCLS